MLYGFTTVICTKTLFLTQVKYYKFPLLNSKSKNTIFLLIDEIVTKVSVTNSKFKTTDVILMCLEILLHKHKAVIKVPKIVKQTVSRK